MSSLTLFRGASALVSWDCESGAQQLRSPVPEQSDLAVPSETDFVSFEVSDPVAGVEYSIRIGELWIAEFVPEGISPSGVRTRGLNTWSECVYFDSARGFTKIRLYSGVDSAESKQLLTEGTVYVVPAKVGEDAYQSMSADLAALSKSLLSDLYGKSRNTFNLRHSKALRNIHSKEEELQAIRSACPTLSALLGAISRHPSFNVVKERRNFHYRGQRALSPRALVGLAQKATRRADLLDGARISDWALKECFDIPEHRFLKAFLVFLRSRARGCGAAARRHIQAIESDRPYRDVYLPGRDGRQTLYQAQDLPIIDRLEAAVKDASQVVAVINQMLHLPLLRDVRAEFVPVRGGMFGRSREYRELQRLMLRHLRRHLLWVEGDSFNNIGKLTHTLYEQWCYLRIVDAFRASGVSLEDWTGSFDRAAKSRFTIDFARGMYFEGQVTPTLKLRISYQPWIHNLETASALMSSLYRGGKGSVPWSPDIVLEVRTLQKGEWVPNYAVVFDSKYSRRLRDSQWSTTGKYLEIRATHSRRQVCRQLWLVAPLEGGDVFRCEDPDVSFGDGGPSMPADETVRLSLSAIPAPDVAQRVFEPLATGLLVFIKTNFSTL